jgi:hypothetical protein
MKHSGCEKRNRGTRQSQLYLRQSLLILLLTLGFLFALPEVASTSDIKETDLLCGSVGSSPTVPRYVQNEENVFHWENTEGINQKGSLKDQEIEQEIIEEIENDSFIESKDIIVTVVNEVVTLEGTVNNLTERAAATANAFQGGAKQVWNHLKVRDSPMLTNKKNNTESL